MSAIKSARKLIAADPACDTARTLSQLVLALQSEEVFDLAKLYELDLPDFDLALGILSEWRLARYYAGKAKLFDMSYQVKSLSSST
ncbi:hypothetical protein PEC18_03590 [Paucibacter sp. O1-1]|nr:hypothetical protein [Paucibacter sp. O1-1]MCU7369507.1 hypothetical protein [Paucibacter sp. O1-1]MCU7369509.1 hypothetical protein [Paucibacter sp. O1-1]MCU7369972.1 hypothetical protein [Paucibacter sp. O1-1]MDA3824484.1 hypothetical protein [Paucibacter sp. O1-1]